VRREEAGDALRFPEDVPVYEDFECYARLAQRGLAGFMDCQTAWQRQHSGPRLTDADLIANADTALTIIGRVWGADEAYMTFHRDEFEAVMDAHRDRKFRHLLSTGRRREARDECVQFFHLPWWYRPATYIPDNAMQPMLAIRRHLSSSRLHGGSRNA
jgi:hypothetical protein